MSVKRCYKILRKDIEISYIRGSGPGGQHKNKRLTGVRMRHLPTGLVAMATERRNRVINWQMAMERLEAKIESFYYRPPERRETRPKASAVERRLNKKGKRSQTKKLRKTGKEEWG